MLAALRCVIHRDLLLAARRSSDVMTVLLFFVIVVSLFPLGIGPDPALLRTIAPGVIWVAALLASMLALQRMFASDHSDGTLEQMLLGATPLGMTVAAKVFAHWLVSGLPLVLISPVLALQFDFPQELLGVLTLSLALGTPVLSLIGAIGAGLYIGFFRAPTDAQQGEAYRIIFIHVPAAWMSMFLYLVMAFWAGLGLAFNTRLSGMMASAIAPTGALFTFLALWTGSFWGKPTWGTWWVWDARLTSELILLFLYFGFMALQAAIDDPRRADKAGAVLALVGVVNIPIIYFSVKWWNTLHQGASVSLTKAPTMATTMLTGMVVMAFGFWFYSIAAVLMRARCIMLERERASDWVVEYAKGPA